MTNIKKLGLASFIVVFIAGFGIPALADPSHDFSQDQDGSDLWDSPSQSTDDQDPIFTSPLVQSSSSVNNGGHHDSNNDNDDNDGIVTQGNDSQHDSNSDFDD